MPLRTAYYPTTKPYFYVLPPFFVEILHQQSLSATLDPAYLQAHLTLDQWVEWWNYQQLVGGEVYLIPLIPEAYLNYIQQLPVGMSNTMTIAASTEVPPSRLRVIPYQHDPVDVYVVLLEESLREGQLRSFYSDCSTQLQRSMNFPSYATLNNSFLFKKAAVAV